MGWKFPSCLPQRRRRDRGGGEAREPRRESCSASPEVPSPGARPAPSSRSSSRADSPGEGGSFSGKARLSFRHQLDSEIDSTH